MVPSACSPTAGLICTAALGKMPPEPATHTAKLCSSAASETQHLHRKRVGGTPPSNAPVQQHAAQQQGALPPLLITEGGSAAHLTPHMLCVTVQRAGPLAPDLLLSSPVIRLHVVHAANGEYVRLRQQQLHPLGSSTTAGAAAGTVQESAGLSPALQAEVRREHCYTIFLPYLGCMSRAFTPPSAQTNTHTEQTPHVLRPPSPP